MNKTYCINCKYYNNTAYIITYGILYNICERPPNIIGTKIIPASPIEPEVTVDVYEDNFITCQCENKDNNCKYFDRKLG